LIQTGSLAPSRRVLDVDGSWVEISRLWQQQPVLLFFLRHSGCAVCRAHLLEIRDNYTMLQQAGGKVAVVTFGDPQLAAQIKERWRLPFEIVADPSLQIYREFGLTEGTLAHVFSPDVLMRQLSQALRGNVPYIDPRQGHVTQLGGVAIVDRNGVIRFSYTAVPIYRYPPISTYVTWLTEAANGFPTHFPQQ
jgi:peroxiredoxin